MTCVLRALGEEWESGVLRYHEQPQQWWVAPKLIRPESGPAGGGRDPRPGSSNLRAGERSKQASRRPRTPPPSQDDLLWGCAKARLPDGVEARAAVRGGHELVLRLRHQALRNEQVNQAVHTRSVGAWKKCLSHRLKAVADRELGALLAAAGYDTALPQR